MAARLPGLRDMNINESRLDLASAPAPLSTISPGTAETSSLFRAPWTLRSGSGTAAFLPAATLRNCKQCCGEAERASEEREGEADRQRDKREEDEHVG